MDDKEVEKIIEKFNLSPLEGEGGYFVLNKELNHSNEFSHIYYLISEQSFSHLHKLTSTEIWSCVAGDVAEQLLINENGDFSLNNLSHDGFNGSISSVIDKNIWQATRLVKGGKWALFTITVVPPYKDEIYTEATSQILNEFPHIPHLSEFIN